MNFDTLSAKLRAARRALCCPVVLRVIVNEAAAAVSTFFCESLHDVMAEAYVARKFRGYT